MLTKTTLRFLLSPFSASCLSLTVRFLQYDEEMMLASAMEGGEAREKNLIENDFFKVKTLAKRHPHAPLTAPFIRTLRTTLTTRSSSALSGGQDDSKKKKENLKNGEISIL